MTQEKKHEQEYRQHAVLRRTKRNEFDINNIEDFDELNDSDKQKIKKEKSVKITKMNNATAHIGRAKNKREIVKAMGVNYIKDQKDKRI